MLILVDTVRCPRNMGKEMSRTLGYFYDHLAKGIYAEVCGLHISDFAEMEKFIENERVEHYLDGPNGVDWIFPNHITQCREDDLYVGYVRDDSEEAGEGKRYWTCPRNDDLIPYWTHPVIKLARALHQVGATAPAGLAAVAELWRPFEVRPETGWDDVQQLNRRTLEVMEEHDLLAAAPNEVYAPILEYWPFPLWPLDLRLKKVEKEELREIRSQWAPDW